MNRAIGLIFSLSILLTGCANLTHLTREKTLLHNNEPLGESVALVVDAKQRAIIGTTVEELTEEDSYFDELFEVVERRKRLEKLISTTAIEIETVQASIKSVKASNPKKESKESAAMVSKLPALEKKLAQLRNESLAYITTFNALGSRLATLQQNISTGKKRESSVTHLRKFCAEPSPDALSALAASQGFSFSKPDIAELTQSLAISEGASSIGLRTQSIQLMRDAMYRYCEGYLSGSLNGPSFQTLHRRLQSSMVAILAIEQITGAIKPPAVSIGSSSISGSADLIAKYTERTEEAKAAQKKAQTALDESTNLLAEKTVALDAKKLEQKEHAEKVEKLRSELASLEEKKKSPPTGEKPEDIQNEIDAKEKEISDEVPKTKTLQESVASLEEEKGKLDTANKESKESLTLKTDSYEAYNAARIKLVGGAGGAANTTVVVSPENGDRTKATEEIAKSVTKIVQDTLELNFAREACATYLSNADWNSIAPIGSIAEKCNRYLEATIESVNQQTDSRTEYVSTLSNLIRANPTISESALDNIDEKVEKTLGSDDGKGSNQQLVAPSR